jgi:hypothetical protein
MNEQDGVCQQSGSASMGGPVFVAGRQHSGNTMVAAIIGRHPGCWAHTNENVFIERRELIDKLPTSAERAERVIGELRIGDTDEQEERKTAEHLRAWAREHPEADALALFLEGMRDVTSRTGNDFWLMKATSYIFYAREILESIPDARIIFLMRNPYDIGASRKKRVAMQSDRFNDLFVNMSISWNRGFRIAREMTRRYPDRFVSVRYEDLTTRPEEEMARVFEFLGLAFDPSYLDIPHINPAEKQFRKEDVAGVRRDSLQQNGESSGAKRGINKSRLYYYRERLNPSEIALIDRLIDEELVREHYPELPHEIGGQGVLAKIRATGMLAIAPLRIAKTILRTRKMRGFSIGWLIARLRKRVFGARV